MFFLWCAFTWILSIALAWVQYFVKIKINENHPSDFLTCKHFGIQRFPSMPRQESAAKLSPATPFPWCRVQCIMTSLNAWVNNNNDDVVNTITFKCAATTWWPSLSSSADRKKMIEQKSFHVVGFLVIGILVIQTLGKETVAYKWVSFWMRFVVYMGLSKRMGTVGHFTFSIPHV